MPKYRKKPIEVEAVQWPGPWAQVPGVCVETVAGNPSAIGGELVRHYVVTIHGQRAYLAPGDWVITEPNNENHYPCKDDVFRATYDPVPPRAPSVAAAQAVRHLVTGARAPEKRPNTRRRPAFLSPHQ